MNNVFSAEKYIGKVFVTENNSRYGIVANCQIITERQSISNARADLAAGINPCLEREVRKLLSVHDEDGNLLNERGYLAKKAELDNFIKAYGQDAKEGLMLVFSLKPEDVLARKRIGLKTSPLTEVI